MHPTLWLVSYVGQVTPFACLEELDDKFVLVLSLVSLLVKCDLFELGVRK